MDSLKRLQTAVEAVLEDYAKSRSLAPGVDTELIFDTRNHHYQILNVGWQNGQRIHGIILHIDIIQSKLWIQHNGTEVDIAQRLIEAGISPQEIVLGFQSPSLRRFTEFASG
jgi:hypothetical protein